MRIDMRNQTAIPEVRVDSGSPESNTRVPSGGSPHYAVEAIWIASLEIPFFKQSLKEAPVLGPDHPEVERRRELMDRRHLMNDHSATALSIVKMTHRAGGRFGSIQRKGC
jgi:hypothetical protein